MKILSTILIIIITSLIVNPSDYFRIADSIIDSTTSCIKNNYDYNIKDFEAENKVNDIKKCDNPFMCCCHSGFIIISPLDSMLAVRIETYENNFYIQPEIQNSNNSIWRPPKLF